MAGFFSKLKNLFTGSDITDDFYEEIEENLVMADCGIYTAERIIDALREKVKKNHIKSTLECKEALMESMAEQMYVPEDAYDFEKQTSVVLLIGVNGVGKTTTIGKLAMQLKAQGKKVLICAADTFRAAAIEQLGAWADRAGVEMISQHEGADPAAVVFDAINAAKARNVDVVLCDTAGRLQNKKNLMEELGKINRIIDNGMPEAKRETLVVLDGTTGQNALVQAREFNSVAPVSGIVITKLDGSAKGGVAVAVQAELNVPVKYIGVGEKITDLIKFDPKNYVRSLFEE